MVGKIKWFMFFGLLGLASADITISHIFERNFGWKVYFTWDRSSADKALQNITIWRNGQELIVYKPAEDSTHLQKNLTSDNYDMNITCFIIEDDQKGKCTIMLNVKHNATDDIYKAQTQWGPPHWEKETTEAVIIVSSVFPITDNEEQYKASKPMIRETHRRGARQVLNCSSEGVPAPKLLWTVGEGKDAREIEADFNHTSWNETTKLWHSWSVYKPTTHKQISVVCTPHQLSRKGKWDVSAASIYPINSAGIIDSSRILTTILLAVAYYTHMR